MFHIVVSGGRYGGIDAPRQRREGADDGPGWLQIGDRSERLQRIGGRRFLDRQARQREPGDVDLLDRPASVVKAIEWRGGDELETCRAQLFEQRTERRAVAGGELF